MTFLAYCLTCFIHTCYKMASITFSRVAILFFMVNINWCTPSKGMPRAIQNVSLFGDGVKVSCHQKWHWLNRWFVIISSMVLILTTNHCSFFSKNLKQLTWKGFPFCMSKETYATFYACARENRLLDVVKI